MGRGLLRRVQAQRWGRGRLKVMEETLQVHPPACDRVTGWRSAHSITLPGPRPAASSRPFPYPPRQSGPRQAGPRLLGSPSAQESGLAGSISGDPEVRWEAEPSPKGGFTPGGGAAARKRARSRPPRGSWRGRCNPTRARGREPSGAAPRPECHITRPAALPAAHHAAPCRRCSSPCWSSLPPGPGASSSPGTPEGKGPPGPGGGTGQPRNCQLSGPGLQRTSPKWAPREPWTPGFRPRGALTR